MRLIITLLCCSNLLASIGEQFGASSRSIALGGQASLDALDPSNNFYAPAVLAEDNQTSISYSSFYISSNFKKINNIVVDSPINSGGSTEVYGDIDPNITPSLFHVIHTSFKIFKRLPAKFNLSLFLPTEKVLEADSGDPYRPEYVMYQSRFNRTQVIASYSQKLSNFNISVGILSGFQSNGETFVVAKDNGSTTPSSGKVQFNAKPSAAFNFSIYKQSRYGKSFFSFQDEMKSKLENKAQGYTPIGTSPINFSWDLSSLLYYDPQIMRVGHKIDNFNFTLEYQNWDGYESPTLKLEANSNSTLVSSFDNKNFKTKSIFIPRISYQLDSLSFGAFYRPSPLTLKKGASGNSVDSDLASLSLGHRTKLKFFEQDFFLDSSFMFQHLITKEVSKSPNRENNESGQKIGAPFYDIGGEIYALSIGLSWVI